MHLIRKIHEQTSRIVTTNLTFGERPTNLGDATMTATLRLQHGTTGPDQLLGNKRFGATGSRLDARMVSEFRRSAVKSRGANRLAAKRTSVDRMDAGNRLALARLRTPIAAFSTMRRSRILDRNEERVAPSPGGKERAR